MCKDLRSGAWHDPKHLSVLMETENSDDFSLKNGFLQGCITEFIHSKNGKHSHCLDNPFWIEIRNVSKSFHPADQYVYVESVK